MKKHWISQFWFLIVIKFVNTCQCNKTHENKKHLIKNNTEDYVDKRQLEFEDFSTTEYYFENTTETGTFDPLTIIDQYYNLTDLVESNSDLNESILEMNETVFEATETVVDIEDVTDSTTETTAITKKWKPPIRDMSKKCHNFKKGVAFDLRKMADVWQIVYYRLPSKLKCFKIHIKLVEYQEQLHYAKIYGNFNNTVYWRKCHLEIKTSDRLDATSRKHFLQGDESEKGVMDNIIIDEEHCQNSSFLTLHRESADQWLVIKNLLVMRDCDTGDIVVFSRVPLEPRRDDILDALMVFGENKINGTMACEASTEKTWIKYDESVISN